MGWLLLFFILWALFALINAVKKQEQMKERKKNFESLYVKGIIKEYPDWYK